jgi:hypothetical protein
VTVLNDVYAPPANDEESQSESESAADDDEEGTAAPVVWFAIPVWRLWLFSLFGGSVYQMYWMYRCWRAFRASMGYSRHERWHARYERNRFRASPFWRAVLQLYTYCWMLVVRREALRYGVPSFGPPWLWFALQLAAITLLPFGWNLLALSLAFLPAQLAVNRMQDKLEGSRVREPVTAAELCWLAVGVFIVLKAAATVVGLS